MGQINARKIHGELNVFDGIFVNKFFLAIMGMEFFMQFLMVQLPGINTGMGCTGLSFGEWILCIFVGATELALNPLIRKVSVLPMRMLPDVHSLVAASARHRDAAQHTRGLDAAAGAGQIPLEWLPSQLVGEGATAAAVHMRKGARTSADAQDVPLVAMHRDAARRDT